METLIGLSFICIGSVISFVGVSLFRRSFQLVRKGVRTVGRVVGTRHIDLEAAPELEIVFTDESGVERQCHVSRDRKGQSIGDPISLVYDQDDPKNVLGTTYFQLWYWPNFFCLLGGVFVLVGAGTLVVYWR